MHGLPTFFVYALRRVTCLRCGTVRVERVPWTDGPQRSTRALDCFLANWARLRLGGGQDCIRSALPDLEPRVRQRGSGGGLRELRIFDPIAREDLRTLEEAERKIARLRAMLEQLPGDAPSDGLKRGAT